MSEKLSKVIVPEIVTNEPREVKQISKLVSAGKNSMVVNRLPDNMSANDIVCIGGLGHIKILDPYTNQHKGTILRDRKSSVNLSGAEQLRLTDGD